MRALVLVAVGSLASGCDRCLELPEECTSQYDASTFDAVYANTISVGCALSACHGGSTGQGELALGTTADEAYQAIRAFVEPGNAACSELMMHLEPSGLGDMPPGQLLSDLERCSVRQWIDQGALR